MMPIPHDHQTYSRSLSLSAVATLSDSYAASSGRGESSTSNALRQGKTTRGIPGDEDEMTRRLCRSAKLLADTTSMGKLAKLKRRLAQVDLHHNTELARGGRQRLSPAASEDMQSASGLTQDSLVYHTKQGRLWAALCNPLPGLLCLIPLYREQLEVTFADYTGLNQIEQEVLRKLLDDDYGKVLCSAAAAFLRLTKGETADVEFLWEKHRDVCMDTCDEQVMLRLIQEVPYQDENVWVPEKHLNWTRPTNWPKAWPWPADPTSTPRERNHPLYCEGTHCDCLGRVAISTPLIRFYGKKGRGLQAVANRAGTVAYMKGEVLGVLTGEILPPGTYDNDPWTLDFVRSGLPDEPVVCQIRSVDMGSRFGLPNAAVNPCARLQPRRRSDKYVTAVVPLRDIMDGEEITVSYGWSRATMEEAGYIV